MARFNYTAVDGIEPAGSILRGAILEGARTVTTELVTNGNFYDGSTGWTLGTGWTVENGEAVKTDTSGTATYLSQIITFPSTGTYIIEATIGSQYTSGTMNIGSASGTATYSGSTTWTVAASGKTAYKYYTVTVAGYITLQIQPSAYAAFSISKVSCRKIVASTAGDYTLAQLYTSQNAASPSEANATTGFTSSGLSGTGANVFQSQATTKYSGSYAIEASCNDTPTNGARFYQDIGAAFSLESGALYELSFYIRHVGSGGVWGVLLGNDNTGSGTDYILITTVSSTDTTFTQYKCIFKYNSSYNTYLIVRERSGTDDGGVFFDALSIKKTNNMISNGQFNAIAGSGSPWTLGTGWTISGGVATHATGAAGYLDQTTSLTANQRYMIKYTLTGAGAGSLLLANAASGNNNVTLTNSNGTHITYWTQGSQNLTTLRIYASSSFAGSLDDIEVWPVADDYSDSDHPLYVVGQLATRNVAPSSGVIAYGSFYISQQYAWLEAPYHSDFDPGTGDFAYLTWFKTNGSSSTAYLLSRQNSSATGARIYLYMTSTGTITGVANDGTAYSVTSNGIYNDGLWHCVIFQKTSAGLQLYIDGTLDNSATGPSLTMTNTTALFRVGISYADASPWFGEIAGVGVYIGTSFTAADAKALYDTEKGLFSYGAPFSVVGNAYLLDVGMLNGGEQGEDVQRKVNQSLSGIHETLFHSRRRNWTMTTQALPYVSDSQTDLMQIKHFIRSVQRGQTFSFNDRIGFDAFEGEYNVILDQASTAMPRVGDTVDYHRITLKLKEQ